MSTFEKNLAQTRCLHHPDREAVAKCLDCERFFCRECVTEHEDRIICAICLRDYERPVQHKKWRLGFLFLLVQCVLGVLVVWIFFYYLGQGLLSLPDAFHDGTLWKNVW